MPKLNANNGNGHSLETWLWDAACSIRGEIEASKYKDFIIPLIFLKRLDDVFEDELLKISESREISLAMVKEDHKLVRFYIPEETRWSRIMDQQNSLGEYITSAMRRLSRENPKLEGVVDIIDFNESTGGQRTISDNSLRKLLEILNQKRLGLNDIDSDLLGNAYEYLLGKFSEGSGKSAGEFYTPREIAELIGRILDPQEGEEIYDPACGSGGLLVRAFSAFVSRHGNDSSLNFPKLYGQEINRTTYAMARMNAIIHDVEADIRIGDTMERPAFLENDGSLRVFDKVTANPMWNQNFDPKGLENDPFNRFSYGTTPKSSGDWAWIQHMLASAKSRVAVVLDQGSLFRGNTEGKIRSAIVSKDLLEGVVSLPEKLFYNTGAPGAILIFNKDKPVERKGRICFINASNEFRKHIEIRRLNQLSPENINRIAHVFESFSDEAGFSRVVDLEEIEENNGNINVTMYVSPVSDEEQIDIRTTISEIAALDQDLAKVESKLKGFLKELGYLD